MVVTDRLRSQQAPEVLAWTWSLLARLGREFQSAEMSRFNSTVLCDPIKQKPLTQQAARSITDLPVRVLLPTLQATHWHNPAVFTATYSRN